MIDLHYRPMPNGWKVSIMLEECGLPYTLKPVNIGRGEQFSPEFLAISPNNRMPAIVDHDPPGGGAPVAVFESGAILIYLAERTGRFLPADHVRMRRRHVLRQRSASARSRSVAARRAKVKRSVSLTDLDTSVCRVLSFADTVPRSRAL
jgi:glutathione S-transferase